MEIVELDPTASSVADAVGRLVEHDLAPEFRPLPPASVRQTLAGACQADRASWEQIRDLSHLGVYADDGNLLGAAAVGWRDGLDETAGSEAVIIWAHARENNLVLRRLLASAAVRAVDLASRADDQVSSLVACDFCSFAGDLAGVPSARRAATHSVLTELGFSSVPGWLLLEGPARARLRLAEADLGTPPSAPAGFEFAISEPESGWFEVGVVDGDGRLVSECACGLLGDRGAEVTWLWTDLRWRWEGFGRLVLRRALAILDEAGAEVVRLQIRVEEPSDRRCARPALGLYTTVGFHVADELSSFRLEIPAAAANLIRQAIPARESTGASA